MTKMKLKPWVRITIFYLTLIAITYIAIWRFDNLYS